jgi:predicted nucleic acid-binding protein
VIAKAIIDTDILSEYLKGHDSTATGHAAHSAQEHGIFTFANVTVHEIVHGLELKNASIQLSKALVSLRQKKRSLRSTLTTSRQPGSKQRQKRKGLSLELPDCLIAAVAIRLGLPRVTGNTEDFQAIQKTGVDLPLENWRLA